MDAKREENTTHLSPEEAKRFARAVNAAPKTNDRLMRAIQYRRRIIYARS